MNLHWYFYIVHQSVTKIIQSKKRITFTHRIYLSVFSNLHLSVFLQVTSHFYNLLHALQSDCVFLTFSESYICVFC